MSPLAEKLVADIALNGPISVAEFMARALYDRAHGYYTTRNPIGARGDFVTAPEISPLFGEMIGLWCVQTWIELGAPTFFHLIELGPGRGTLMADILRASRVRRAFAEAAHVRLVEVNPNLKNLQAQALAARASTLQWVGELSDVPPGPSIIIGNEFLDCFPVRQFVRASDGWREKLVGLNEAGALAFGLSGLIADAPAWLNGSETERGSVIEFAPALLPFVDSLAERLKDTPGRALFIDYGGDGIGDTLQAMTMHAKSTPLEAPGEHDLTAHVDFAALAHHAAASGLSVAGPIGQGAFLANLGIATRAEAVVSANPARANATAGELARLINHDQMGTLFKVAALSSSVLPPPTGFPQ